MKHLLHTLKTNNMRPIRVGCKHGRLKQRTSIVFAARSSQISVCAAPANHAAQGRFAADHIKFQRPVFNPPLPPFLSALSSPSRNRNLRN